MGSYDAMKESAGEQNTSIISEIAKRCHIPASTAYSWTRPPENNNDDCDRATGRRNPVDSLEQWMESCLILGRPRGAALSPLTYLNNHFNQIVFDVPSHVKAMTREELSAELIRCMKEFGDVVASYQAAMKNGRISKQEMKRIEREVWEAATELFVFLHCAREAGK